MFNPYTIILSLFIVAGILATIWGWLIVARARKTLQWPNVEGVIEESRAGSESDDLLPHIVFSYDIKEKTYKRTMDFPGDVTPTQEFTNSYLNKYPQGKTVSVFYEPGDHENATIEPGLGNGDWFVLALGIGTTIFGILFLFF